MAEIERLQPYHADDPDRHPLWTLHSLHVADKHRLLHILGVASVDAALQIKIVSPGIHLHHSYAVHDGPVEDGTELARAVLVFNPERYRHYLTPRYPGGPVYDYDVDMKLKNPFEVAFDQSGPGKGRSLLHILHAVHNGVCDVFDALEAFHH